MRHLLSAGDANDFSQMSASAVTRAACDADPPRMLGYLYSWQRDRP